MQNTVIGAGLLRNNDPKLNKVVEMKLLNLLVSGLLCLSSTAAIAGDEILNGGDVVMCPGYEVPSYYVLDLQEGISVYGFEYAVIPGATYKEIVTNTLNRLNKFDTTRASLLKEYWATFATESRIVNNNEFGNITDEGWTSVPKNCSLQQAAVQLGQKTPDGIKYLINGAIWYNMNERSKAALVVHELIYREGRLPENDFKNARGVRYFNAFLHSTKFDTATADDYIKAVDYSGFKH